MHTFTKSISQLKSDLRDAEATRLRQTDPIKKALCRGKERGLQRAITLLERHRSEKMDELAEMIRET